MMEKKEIIDQLAELLKGEDIEKIAAEVPSLEEQYEQALEEKVQTEKETYIAEGGEEHDFSPEKDDEDHRFKELINLFNDRFKKHRDEQKALWQENLDQKLQVIEDFKKLLEEEDRIGKAFNSFNELREQWKSIGDVHPKKYKELQSEWHHQLDKFFYTIDIYKSLKEHDLHKNLEHKVKLIDNIQRLLDEKSIKKTEILIKTYQNEWSETGPVPRTRWEEIGNNFLMATRQVYQKINDHYKAIRDQHQENLKAKTQMTEKVERLLEQDITSHNEWREKTEQLIQAQKDWKKSGFAGPNNDKIWNRFRTACDSFFEQKKIFYGELKDEYKDHRDKKQELIKKVEALKDDTDWKETTQQIIGLQKQWKAVGSAGPRDENKLWKQFRAACDHFFNAKKEFFDTLDDRHAENLKQKEALVKEMEAFKVSDDKKKDIETLKSFSQRWQQLGHVPKKEISRISDAYKKALDKGYNALDLDKKEKSIVRFKNKVEGMQASDDAGQLLQNERKFFQRKVRDLEGTINQYEENLSFFGPSNKPNPLKKQVEDKIEKAKKELEELKDKLKLIPKAGKKPEKAGS